MHSSFPTSCLKYGLTTLTMLFIWPLLAVQPAHAQTESVLYSFCGQPVCTDGANPLDVTLVMDNEGDLYGTTASGGSYGVGAVFEVTLSGTETIMHSFAEDEADGAQPHGGLIFDDQGNLYGMTAYGGAGPYMNMGTVFELTPGQNGWTETILLSFNYTNGAVPLGSLIRDSSGNLYGTTSQGGAYEDGVVFELTPSGTETVLHSFPSKMGDGMYPGDLVMDKEGNLYGTTGGGGYYGYGTVFKMTPSGTETILYHFGRTKKGGYYPSSLVLDKKGNLYGTTGGGGPYKRKVCGSLGCGTVFKLTPSGTETILHSFDNNGTDGFFPNPGLIRDAKGNLYGTTYEGGDYGARACNPISCGTVFMLKPSGAETVLHSFGVTGDGANPSGGVAFDANGNLYGTTTYGGANPPTCDGGVITCGTVFKLRP